MVKNFELWRLNLIMEFGSGGRGGGVDGGFRAHRTVKILLYVASGSSVCGRAVNVGTCRKIAL